MEFKYKFPEMKEYTMDNGLQVILIPNKMQPVVTAALRICRGTLNDPVNFEGAAEMLAGVVQKGGAGKDADEFSEIFESRGALVSGMVKEEYATYSVRTLAKFQNDLAPLFKKMVVDAVIDKKEFSIIKKEMVTGFKAELSSPSVLSASHFNGELFGAKHPAGRIKSVKSIKAVTLESIEKYYKDHYSPQNSLLVISGDATFDELKEIWADIFSEWKNPDSIESLVEKADVPQKSKTKVRLIDKPELTQTTIMMGHEIPGELAEDRLSIAIANYILGGGNFSSRLMKKVRTELGNTYGIASHVWAGRYFGTFSVSTSTRNDSLKQVLETIINCLKEIIDNGITQEELDKAKQFALGSMAFELEGLENVIEKILWLRFTKRDNLYIENAEERLSAVNVNTINEALKEHFRVENIVISATGKKSEIEETLSDFGDVSNFNFRKPVHK